MKKSLDRIFATFAAGLSLFACIGMASNNAHAQGLLTPPPGAPAPTMKTLDQVQPRIPISALPFSITNSGSYYFTTNLVAAGTSDTITINANDVSIDLNGFGLIGGQYGHNGIYSTYYCTNITIMNGHVDNWEQGIVLTACYNVTIDHVDVANCTGNGISLGDQSFVTHCHVVGNLHGVATQGGTIADCVATGNTGYGLEIYGHGLIQDSRAMNNGYGGLVIQDGSIINCVSESNMNTGIYISTDGLVKNCHADYNTNYGIYVGRGTVNDSQALGNGHTGIYAAGDANFSGDTSSQNGAYGFFIGNHGNAHACAADQNSSDNFNINSGSTITGCSATQSRTGSGFNVAFAVNLVDSVSFSNRLNGINAYERCSINNCTANWNGSAGAHVTFIGTVQNSQFLENGTFGIFSDGGGLVSILQNHCSHNGTNAFSGGPTTGAGIFITNSPYCHIDNNMCTFNNYGIVVAPSQRCFMTKNSAAASTTSGYSFGSGNSYGPIVSVGAVGDISSTSGASQPQANFSY